jgi:aryl-alcohol dehydrogenase-like predicted oxidoreductase
MRYGAIPTTDLRPSVICLGALPFGVSVPQDISFSLIDAFFEAGGTFIDTALVYGEWLPGGKGLSERTVGDWITSRHHRDMVVLSTKGCHPRLATMEIPRLSEAELCSDLDDSLRNLQTEYIDLYWLHRDDPNRPVAEILEMLQRQVQAGKILAFGCSNWRVERIQEAQAYASAHRMPAFVGNQLMWSLAAPNLEALSDPTMVAMDERTNAYHHDSGLPAMAYTPQAHGFFAKLEHATLDTLPESLRSIYGTALNLARLERLKTLANEFGRPLSTLSLAYITSHPFPAYAITTCSTMEQLANNVLAGDVVLPSATLAYLANGA